MKTYAIMIAFLIVSSFHARSQDDEIDDCDKYKSLYYTYLQGEQYRDARTFWLLAEESCDSSRKDFGFYKNARVIYIKLLREIPTDDIDALNAHQDSLAWVYEQGMKYSDDKQWRLDYAQLLVYRKDTNTAKIDSLFEGIELMGDSVNPKYIKSFFRHLLSNHYNRADKEDKEAAATYISTKYFPLVNLCLEQIIVGQETENIELKEQYEGIITFMDKYFLMMYNDEAALSELIGGELSLISDEDELRYLQLNHRIALMDKKACKQEEVYVNHVRQLVSLDSSANSLFRLGNLELALGNYSAAISAYEYAMRLNPENSDEYYYQMALSHFNARDYKSAFYNAKRVNGEYQGKAYIICGQSIAALAQSCGESSFERDANYWLANDYIRKAANLGEEVSAKQYVSKFPSTSDLFNEGLSEGDSFICSCWNESTTVRSGD